jgi:hypothetical protein
MTIEEALVVFVYLYVNPEMSSRNRDIHLQALAIIEQRAKEILLGERK